jgi:cell division ATPase FtsA
MYATAVGLVMNSTKIRKNTINNEESLEENSSEPNDEKNNIKERISILDQFTDKIKNFLDNAE